MEGLTRLVSESLARHGFDRPLDYRRLHWSRWFRCESHHSLLLVPSKPGVFAVAEEIVDINNDRPASEPGAASPRNRPVTALHTFTADGSRASDAAPTRRMLAVSQFFEDDDMAFTLDRMLSRQNPMSARLASGRYFVRFVVIDDAIQRRSICNALNQWIVSSAGPASGIGAHFASSLELTSATEFIPDPDPNQANLFADVNVENAVARDSNVSRSPLPAIADSATHPTQSVQPAPIPSPAVAAPQLDSGAAVNLHCPTSLPSGF